MKNEICRIVRDEERNKPDNEFVEAIKKFLSKPDSKKNRAKVLEAAKKEFGEHVTDSIIQELLNRLLAKDKQIWAELLRGVMYDVGDFLKLQELSPFRNHTLIFFHHPHGDANLAPFSLTHGPLGKGKQIPHGEIFIAISNVAMKKASIFSI